MNARVPSFPDANSRFINELLDAFRKRSKAIKHSVNEWTIAIVDDDGDERVDFHFHKLDRQRFSLTAWSTGEMWFSSCKPGDSKIGGWAFVFGFHLAAKDAEHQQIVATFERSLLATDRATAIQIWADFDPEPDNSPG